MALRARIPGITYLLFFLTAIAGAVVAPALSGLSGISSDAVATAHYIVTHESSVRLALALGLISTACYLALIALFYQLFRPISKTFALLALAFGIVGCAMGAIGSLFSAAPLVVLGGDSYLNVFDAKQLQALALVFLKLKLEVNAVGLVFFGLFQLALGYLIFRSTFLPRFFGVLVALAGIGWLVVLAPPLASALQIPLEVLGFVAEASLMLWLLVMGTNSKRGNAQGAAR